MTNSTQDFDTINDRTGFANGDLFPDAEAVRNHFDAALTNEASLSEDQDERYAQIAAMNADELDTYHDLADDLGGMAQDVIHNHWHMIGQVDRIDDTTIEIVTGGYGQATIITMMATAEPELDDDTDTPTGRTLVTVSHIVEEHMAGGAIASTNEHMPPEADIFEAGEEYDLRSMERDEADRVEEERRQEAREQARS